MLFLHKKLRNVDDIPATFFEKHRHIYGRVEEVVPSKCGVLLRVRHVPGFSINRQTPRSRVKGDFEHETLLVRLHGIETESNPDDVIQQEAVELIGNLVFHKMVELTFMQKEEDHSETSTTGSNTSHTMDAAIAIVKTVVEHNSNALGGLPPKKKDLSIVLAKAGLARPTNAYEIDDEREKEIKDAAQSAKLHRLGIWAPTKGHREHALLEVHGSQVRSSSHSDTSHCERRSSNNNSNHHHQTVNRRHSANSDNDRSSNNSSNHHHQIVNRRHSADSDNDRSSNSSNHHHHQTAERCHSANSDNTKKHGVVFP